MKFIYFLLALVIAILIIIILRKHSNKGLQGEKLVAGKLRKIRKSKCINSLRLSLYDGITEIDHVLIGKMGIVVIETKSISGSVSGNISDKELIHKIGSKTHSLYNPVMQNKTHVDNLIYHLRKMGYDNLPVYSVVVFTDSNIILNIKGSSSTKILKLKELNNYINSLPYSKNSIPYKRIFRKLCAINQKGIFKMQKHNKRINKLK